MKCVLNETCKLVSQNKSKREQNTEQKFYGLHLLKVNGNWNDMHINMYILFVVLGGKWC